MICFENLNFFFLFRGQIENFKKWQNNLSLHTVREGRGDFFPLAFNWQAKDSKFFNSRDYITVTVAVSLFF